MAIVLYELVGSDPQRPFSPHCWKTAWSLAHKRLDFRAVPSAFTAIPSIESGSKTVPVIRDGDKVVADSFDIALYLEETYPDRPSLFGGEGGKALARFVEKWSTQTIHGFLGGALLSEIHACLEPADQAYFRTSREARFGMVLEDAPKGREDRLPGFRASLGPLRQTLKTQPFLGGEAPLFADYIVAGAFQWARVVSPFAVLEQDDEVSHWFDRVLDLYDGLGRKVPAAA